jgi:hypothetical protein
LQNLRVDFFESGVGDTILVTFPSGDVGVVDAHPSSHSQRPAIQNLIAGKKLRFVCLTHPHADHGVDLIPILQSHPNIEEFWHTIHDVPALMYGIDQAPNFPSSVQQFANAMNQEWADFLRDLLAAVAEREIPRHCLRADIQHKVIDGVEVYCLGPEEHVQNDFFDAYYKKLTDPTGKFPNINLLSAILALRYGDAVILLGADALAANWKNAAKRFHALGLPKACVLKVPHHGARNSFDFGKKRPTYLDVCSRSPKAKSVIFAGDAKHPNVDVYDKLQDNTEVFCLSNGLKGRASNPLKLQIPGARAVRAAPVCNPIVSFEVDSKATVTVLVGASCDACPLARTN